MAKDGESAVQKSELQSLELLVSALAGKAVLLEQGIAGEPAWTDGKTIFVNPNLDPKSQIATLIFQASLLASGSINSEVLRKLKRNKVLADRYLVIEGNRALVANEALLPPLMQTFIDQRIAARSDSPITSLAIALGKEPIEQPLNVFGCINARQALATVVSHSKRAGAQSQIHKPRRQHEALKELETECDDDNESSAAVDAISIGGAAGFFGRWLQRFLKSVRRGQGRDGGTPGADSATHLSRRFTPRGGLSVVSTTMMGAVDDVIKKPGGLKYPEWDMRQKNYKHDWCTVHEIPASIKEGIQPPASDSNSLRRPLARIGLGLDHCHRQLHGDDIDIDAAIEARIEVRAGSTPDENFYVNSQRRRRDLSVLILLDISGSTGEPSSDGQSVHQQQCHAAASLTSALYNLGDRVALYAYNSRGRSEIQLTPIKRFDSHFNSCALQQLHSLQPGGYSRLGAAIRHGAAVLESTGGTSRRLLMVLSDGLAYDHGYEKDYGAADARRALAEARRRGTGSVCLTFGLNTDTESLRSVFGSAAHATLTKHSQLGEVIGPLFRTALRTAEVKRKAS